mmetsp:Transcript_8388/g.11726  ORF Transcript_8388/g.11726 Transcript_8388/m.11726 type:complete len:493 (-) Transcript_8388:204-1682(-)
MDDQLRRAIEASKQTAQQEKQSRQRDTLLQQALAASKAEEERRKAEIARQAQARERKATGNAQMSEEEQMRLAIEASKKEEERRKALSNNDEALKLAIENSKKTAKEEEDRRRQEEQELNFALQLSAALYRASNVSRQLHDQKGPVQGHIQKEYAVPVVPGTLDVNLIEAQGLPNMKTGMNRMKPYVVLRVMSIAPVGILNLTIHKAEGLRKIQMIGQQDPYAIVTLDGRRKATTKVHYDSGRTPVWEEKKTVTLTGKEKSGSIEIQIWNKNMMSDERIGYAYLDVADVLSPSKKKWLRVNRKKGKHHSSSLDGKVCVSWDFQAHCAPSFKPLKVLESKTGYVGGPDPKWENTLTVKDMVSNCYVQATLRNKKTFGTDTILAISNVISVQGAIHQNFFTKGKNTWYPLTPSNATRSKCTNNNAGKIKLEIKFRDEDHPDGIVPEEIEPRIPDVDVIEGAQVVSSGPVVEATVVNAHAQVGSGDVLAAEVQPF